MNNDSRVYVGTYSEAILFGTGEVFQGKGSGIHQFRVSRADGRTEALATTTEVRNPSYLCLDRSGRFLYAVNELKSYDGEATGTLSAFSVEPSSGRLHFLNLLPTGGTDPCHVELHPSGRYVMVANFMSGSVSVYSIAGGGSLAARTHFVQHHGSSVNPTRQKGPHAHSSIFDADGGFVFIPDLGLDRVVAYRFDLATGTLTEAPDAGFRAQPGAGPRHLVFSPERRHAYIVNELASSVTACTYDTKRGTMTAIGTTSALPADFRGDNTCADIHMHPSGRFVYASNRGHDSIAVFARDAASGRLTAAGHSPSGGRTPRNFAIDPSGELMLVANQASDNIVAFRIDQRTGTPAPTGEVTAVGTPVCVRFAPA